MQEKSKTKIRGIRLFLYLGGIRDQSWIVIHGHSNGWSLDADHWLLVWLQHLFCAPQFCQVLPVPLCFSWVMAKIWEPLLQASARVVRLWYSTFARTRTLGVRGVGSPKHPWPVESLYQQIHVFGIDIPWHSMDIVSCINPHSHHSKYKIIIKILPFYPICTMYGTFINPKNHPALWLNIPDIEHRFQSQ